MSVSSFKKWVLLSLPIDWIVKISTRIKDAQLKALGL